MREAELLLELALLARDLEQPLLVRDAQLAPGGGELRLRRLQLDLARAAHARHVALKHRLLGGQHLGLGLELVGTRLGLHREQRLTRAQPLGLTEQPLSLLVRFRLEVRLPLPQRLARLDLLPPHSRHLLRVPRLLLLEHTVELGARGGALLGADACALALA